MMKDNSPNPLFLIAGWSAYASGVVSIIGLAPFVTFFVFAADIPGLNDAAAIVQYLLALPITLALHWLLQTRAPVLSGFAMLIGILGILALAVVQLLVIAGVLSWATVGAPFLMIGIWLVITGYLGRSTGKLPHSLLMSILAATYFAYPIWAFWLGRLLLSGKLTVSGHSPSIRGEIA